MTLAIWTDGCGFSCDPSRVDIILLMPTGGGGFALHHRLIACKPPACHAGFQPAAVSLERLTYA